MFFFSYDHIFQLPTWNLTEVQKKKNKFYLELLHLIHAESLDWIICLPMVVCACRSWLPRGVVSITALFPCIICWSQGPCRSIFLLPALVCQQSERKPISKACIYMCLKLFLGIRRSQWLLPQLFFLPVLTQTICIFFLNTYLLVWKFNFL